MKTPLQTLRSTAFIFLSLFLLLFATPLRAQNYYAINVSGTVKTYLNGKWVDVIEKQKLSDTQRIKIGESSTLKLLQIAESKTVTLTKPFLGTIKTYIESNQSSVEKCTGQWLRYLVGKLLGKNDRHASSIHMPNVTTGYRGDSIEMVIDSILQFKPDTPTAVTTDSCNCDSTVGR